MYQTPDFTKLFSIIDSIVCCLVECRDEANKLYFLTVGYISNNIVLKLDTEDYVSVHRFEFTSPKQAMQKMEWIISERKLSVKVATYYYDPTTNITSDFYIENQIQYSFNARNRTGKPIQVNYTIYPLEIEIDYQILSDRYNEFIAILGQNDYGYKIIEVSPHPNRYLRKSKLLDLLVD